MKKYIITVSAMLLILGACSKNNETPADKKAKTESAITGVVDQGTKIQNSEATLALEHMPGSSPIESSFPISPTGKSVLAATIVHRIPFFKKNATKSPIDSIGGTWEYDDSTGEWVHSSNDPAGSVILIWTFVDTAGTNHTAKFEFTNLLWYNDTLLTKFDANLYVDNDKVAYMQYELTLESGVSTEVAISGAIVGEVEYNVDVKAATGHNLEEDDFYGTVHISIRDLQDGSSFVLDITVNEDGSGSFRLVTNDGNDSWEFYVTVSAPNASGYQTVSGYIKYGDEEMAKIQGTVSEDGDFTQVFIIYPDGTRVALTEYLAGVDTGTGK